MIQIKFWPVQPCSVPATAYRTVGCDTHNRGMALYDDKVILRAAHRRHVHVAPLYMPHAAWNIVAPHSA